MDYKRKELHCISIKNTFFIKYKKYKIATLALIFFLIIQNAGVAQLPANKNNFPLPNRQQIAWQQVEFGVIFHYDLHVFDTSKYNQMINRITPITDYNIFNPAKLNVEQWVLSAKNAGAKFALLTATHETGFALFQSDVNPYCMKALKWKNGKDDIVKDFVDACRKYNIKPGIYLGIRWNSFFGVHDFKVNGEGQQQKDRQQYYNAMVEGMVKEICTRYGPLFEIWFDGGASDPSKGAPDVLPIIEKYQPNCLFYWNSQRADSRWGGSETGTVAYPCWSTFPYRSMSTDEYPQIRDNNFYIAKHGDSSGKYWMPAIADVPLRGYNGRHEWFWEPGDDAHIFPVKDLMNMYYQSVGRNATFILGLTPDNTGLVPTSDSNTLSAFGEEIEKRFTHPIAETNGNGNSFLITLKKAQDINQVSIKEDISKGERIRKYKLEANINGKWKIICSGLSVGNNRIQMFEKIKTKKIRLTITESIAQPQISSFKIYNVPFDNTIRN